VKIVINVSGLDDNKLKKLIDLLSIKIKEVLIPFIGQSLHDNLEQNVYGLTIKPQTIRRKKYERYITEPYIRTGQMVNAFLNTNAFKVETEANNLSISIDNNIIKTKKINNPYMPVIDGTKAVINLEAQRSTIIVKIKEMLQQIKFDEIFE